METDKTISEPAPLEAIILARTVLALISLGLAGYAIYLFLSEHTYTALKFIGFSITFLGGCFDPVNYLWLCLPFGFGELVKPALHARFVLPIVAGGLYLVLWGWLGDGWLINPPKPPDAAISSNR